MAGYHTPGEGFNDAAAYLSSSTSAARASNTVKLEIYGLFKYVTTATRPTTSRPGIFDLAGKAKWDSWASMEKKYGATGQGNAEKDYIEVAKAMGWDGASSSTPAPAQKAAQEAEEEEIDFDSEEEELSRPRPRATRSESSGSSKGGGGGDRGMGLSVSAMARPAEVQDSSIHGATVKGDLERLERLIDEQPELNLDQPDEYGYTPLHLACDRGHLEVVRLLLEKGANRSIKDPDEFTPLELAEVAGRSDIVALLSLSS